MLALLFGLIVLQRLAELVIARSNKAWMLKRGGVEFESGHYPLFIGLHTLFFLAILVEWLAVDYEISWLFPIAFISFLILQLLRVWCITSLGKRWNTRIIVIPKEQLVSRGPYKYVKHPNYVVVFLELFFIPLMFHAYLTALIFPILHLFVLAIRIPAEERVLRKGSENLN
ncbi:isoprenylcysteine carboxyl methyltransferase family protein [Halobacillus hunanensis]|uniref:isoprenylcysteine carboxyl methyltransferase family protein n=1 Tax=Halobacillus hunanensis TaxID=578214 RepID=UPI0009A5C8CB|nr:isoprenylcysteine carboxylmethyltransferase family protein [Halobacillus hunanensis]